MSLLCRALVRGSLSAGRRLPAPAPASALTPALAPARRTYADKMMADPIEHATGLEKKELLAMEAGNDDPFNIKALKKGPGTKDCPTLVPSCFDARIVGCVCEEHATSINWLWLHKGHPRRCECGHWYKLIEKQPL